MEQALPTLRQHFTVDFSYDVLFTEGVFQLDNPLLRNWLKLQPSKGERRCLLMIDNGISKSNGNLKADAEAYFEAISQDTRLVCPPLIMPGGESAKSDLALLDATWKLGKRYAIDRHSYIIAVGGGAFLDAVGMAAATLHRGVRFIRIPTTVLAQNDAGVGVKNAVNFADTKNFIGTFATPVLVINDNLLLQSLDDREWRSGLAEAVKVALLKDPAFFQELEELAPALIERDSKAMQRVIYRCAELHLQHIASGDPFERGSSRPLDFGHWSAHKLEVLTHYKMLHGEAVAIGMSLDLIYAKLQGWLPEASCQRALTLLRKLGFNLFHNSLNQEEESLPAIVRGLQEFQEHMGGELTLIMVKEIGETFEIHHMDTAILLKAVAILEKTDASWNS